MKRIAKSTSDFDSKANPTARAEPHRHECESTVTAAHIECSQKLKFPTHYAVNISHWSEEDFTVTLRLHSGHRVHAEPPMLSFSNRAEGCHHACQTRRNPKRARPTCLPAAERARRQRTKEYHQQIEEFFVEQFGRYVARAQFRGLNYADAKDVAQNAFLGAVAAEARFDRRRKFAPWFWRIWQNQLSELLRKKYRPSRLEPIEQEEVARIAVESESPRPERQQRFRALLDRLPRAEVELLLLHYEAGIPLPLLAMRLGLRLSAVKMRMHRARQTLMAILRKAGFRSLADIEEVGEGGLHLPAVLAPPRPARHQPRPNCARHRKNTL